MSLNIVRFPERLSTNPLEPVKIIRQTHKVCQFETCFYSVSLYEHNYCKYCCNLNTPEYNYHFPFHLNDFSEG